MTEARLAQGKDGWLEPEGEGWYVLNAQDAKWLSNEMGWYCNFEGADRFPEFGFNLNRLPPVRRWRCTTRSLTRRDSSSSTGRRC